jgi:hypothetical protein
MLLGRCHLLIPEELEADQQSGDLPKWKCLPWQNLVGTFKRKIHGAVITLLSAQTSCLLLSLDGHKEQRRSRTHQVPYR